MKIVKPLLYQPIYNTATSVQQIAIEDIEVINNNKEEDDSNENNKSSSF